MEQIIANFQSSGADLLVGVATPVAMRMQTATEDSQTPVVFAAVSDPIGAGLVESLDAPGSNVTGTSDYLDTAAVMKLIFAADPDASKIGLLYDAGQDSSTAAIASAKAYLDENGIEYVEHTGSTADEVMLAAQAMVADGVDAVFTPTDNSIMKAELAMFERALDKAGTMLILSGQAKTWARSARLSSVWICSVPRSARATSRSSTWPPATASR